MKSRRMKREVLILLILAIVGWSSIGFATKVNLINGKQLTGKLVKEDMQSIKLLIGSDPGISVILFKSEIVSLVDEQGKVRLIEPSDSKSTKMAPPVKSAEKRIEKESVKTLRAIDKFEPFLPIVFPIGRAQEVEARMLNVRSGPSTDFEKTGAVPKNTIVIELERQGSWLQVQLPDGHSGWVSGNYTRPLPDEPIVSTTARLNLRQGPGLSYRILRKLTDQEFLFLLKRKDKWIQLRDSQNTVGWVSDKYMARFNDKSSLKQKYTLLGDVPDQVAIETLENVNSQPGSSNSKKMPVRISDFDWLRGGKIALILLATKVDALQWNRVIQGKNIVSSYTFEGGQIQDGLGLDSSIIGNAGIARRVVLKGIQTGKSWNFEYYLSSIAPTDLRILLVGQRNDRRGVICEF